MLITPGNRLEWAARTTELLERSAGEGQGAVGAGGVLIDMAHEKLAKGMLERQALIDSCAKPQSH